MANLLKCLLPAVIGCWAAVPIYGQEIVGSVGQNDTPGGCGDTIHGCDQNGNVYDPVNPNTYFDYEESCNFVSIPHLHLKVISGMTMANWNRLSIGRSTWTSVNGTSG